MYRETTLAASSSMQGRWDVRLSMSFHESFSSLRVLESHIGRTLHWCALEMFRDTFFPRWINQYRRRFFYWTTVYRFLSFFFEIGRKSLLESRDRKILTAQRGPERFSKSVYSSFHTQCYM